MHKKLLLLLAVWMIPLFVIADMDLPIEVQQTREHISFWLENMIQHHGYSMEEAAKVLDWPVEKVRAEAEKLKPALTFGDRIKVLPYPGGRHPRIGFLEGAIDPKRGTKASIFLPWDESSYVVLDLPEAIWCQDGLLFLAHTHIDTIWDAQNIKIPNQDWIRQENGVLENEWVLPNQVKISAAIYPESDGIDLRLKLFNGSDKTFSNLKVQNCIMFKGAKGFEAQSNGNKVFEKPYAAVHDESKTKWIYTFWQSCDRVWGNEDCPCMHSDPQFPDCEPGQPAELQGFIGFYEGDDFSSAIKRMVKEKWAEN